MAEHVRKRQGYGYLVPVGAFESSGTSEESSEESIESGREPAQHQTKPNHTSSLEPPARERPSKKKHRVSGVRSKHDSRRGSEASDPLATSHTSSSSSKGRPEKRHETADPGSYLGSPGHVVQPSVRSAPAPPPCERMYDPSSAPTDLWSPPYPTTTWPFDKNGASVQQQSESISGGWQYQHHQHSNVQYLDQGQHGEPRFSPESIVRNVPPDGFNPPPATPARPFLKKEYPDPRRFDDSYHEARHRHEGYPGNSRQTEWDLKQQVGLPSSAPEWARRPSMSKPVGSYPEKQPMIRERTPAGSRTHDGPPPSEHRGGSRRRGESSHQRERLGRSGSRGRAISHRRGASSRRRSPRDQGDQETPRDVSRSKRRSKKEGNSDAGSSSNSSSMIGRLFSSLRPGKEKHRSEKEIDEEGEEPESRSVYRGRLRQRRGDYPGSWREGPGYSSGSGHCCRSKVCECELEGLRWHSRATGRGFVEVIHHGGDGDGCHRGRFVPPEGNFGYTVRTVSPELHHLPQRLQGYRCSCVPGYCRHYPVS
ncbi:hypothetical protein QBC34DRAFT_206262 [Podospora aff. communis PSN243]|uniref:Uncharacterized protein n=1 Tax=Podospora aff. communis PSN243 TaxID=3040156 RepID=A0AAV9GY90_9PEZI|nr:hypothetical protein QBC34DRAFT_206262 [Podospora aff. communis PSN243]